MKKITIIFLAVLMASTVTVNAQKFIQPIPGQEKMVIEPTSGKEKLADDITFKTDKNYKNYNLDQSSPATPATSAEMFILSNEASFDEVFPADTEKEKVAFSTQQVKNAILKYIVALKNSTAFFLVKNGSKFYVLQVMVREGASGSPDNVVVETWKPDDYLSFGSRDRFIGKKK